MLVTEMMEKARTFYPEKYGVICGGNRWTSSMSCPRPVLAKSIKRACGINTGKIREKGSPDRLTHHGVHIQHIHSKKRLP
jgi:hypothetical protein